MTDLEHAPSGARAAEAQSPRGPVEHVQLSAQLPATPSVPSRSGPAVGGVVKGARRDGPDESVLCEGTLVETDERRGTCDARSACRALHLRHDYPRYRVAHERVVTADQTANKLEYGGEA